ncbi:MAG: DUF262 domain-containing protein [Desulfobacteraceae bacterium]
MLQPQNIVMKYQNLFSGVDTGQIRIPQFQREFIWNQNQTAKLIDSIIKGFPIGTFILWKTAETMRTVRTIGNAELPPTRDGDIYLYVLDGQQRITSLYAVQKGLVIDHQGIRIDYSNICVNLDLAPDVDEEIVLTEPPESATVVSVFDLLNGKVATFAKRFPADEHLERIDVYRSRLTGYDFSTIVMDSYPIDIACEVFTRINTGGTDLTLFEIMVAKTYDIERGFDLAHEYECLVDNNGGAEKDLEDADFDTLPPSTILQCIAADIVQMVRRQDILKLDKNSVIDRWPNVKDGIFAAVDFIRSSFRIPVSQLLPYNALIVPLTYFFIQNDYRPPTANQVTQLEQYFWWGALSSRFSSSAESKLAVDIKRMDDVIAGRQPDYRGEEIRLTETDLRWRWFSASDAVCKAILCLYAYHRPASFRNNAQVKIDNSWLRRADSKNYHHFFPRSFLRKQGYEEWQANSIINITIVDDYLNKRNIRGRAPSEYLSAFQDENPNLNVAIATHLIDDPATSGIWDDDYEKFISERSDRVFQEPRRRLGSTLKVDHGNSE